MKYLVVLGDGMADYKVEELGGKTPLECAIKPNIDKLAKMGVMGLVATVPGNMKPGSDVANLAVMGYDPQVYYSGRSPLEAVSIGISMEETDLAIRCNLVTLSEDEPEYGDKTMVDYSSGEITTQEADELIQAVHAQLGSEMLHFYTGISYRHCLIWKEGPMGLGCTPPHDILEQKITDYLPSGAEKEMVLELQKKSYEILKDHPINIERKRKGLNPANSIWLWGEGRKPQLKDFYQLHGLKASVISAVDLIKGIGLCAGMTSIDVEGATGTVHTNFDGKAKAIMAEFDKGQDFVYAHFEAPDECGHQRDIPNKVKSIELIDEKIVGPMVQYFEEKGEPYSIMVLPDHPTPLKLRTHTSDPVPFLVYRSDCPQQNTDSYTEENARKTGLFIQDGYTVMNYFLEEK